MIVAGDQDKIASLINTLATDTRNLIKAAIEIAYFSRGAWSYNDVLDMPPLVRDLAVEFINGRLESAKTNPNLFY